MKEIFTLLLAVGSVVFVSAQSMAKNDRPNKNDKSFNDKGFSKEMKKSNPEPNRNNQNERTYPGTNKTCGNDGWSKGNGNNNDNYGQQDQRNNWDNMYNSDTRDRDNRDTRDTRDIRDMRDNRNNRDSRDINDNRGYDERRRQEESDRINREYDRRINDYRNDRSINSYERNRRINQAEKERREMIKSFTGAATVGALAGFILGVLVSK